MSKNINRIKSIITKLIDELIKTYKKPEDMLGEDGILKQIQKAMLESLSNDSTSI